MTGPLPPLRGLIPAAQVHTPTRAPAAQASAATPSKLSARAPAKLVGSAAAPDHPQPPQLQPRPALRRGLRPRGRVPDACNQYGSEGPRRRVGRQRVGSPCGKERVEELVPDPEWVDTDQLADMEAHESFTPPAKNRCGMAAAHETWAPGVDKAVVKAITYVTANAIAPTS